jgi:hypothetical protein
MNLDDAQKKQVSEWIAQGLKLSEIQSRLGSELGLSMTYMEVRLLVDDLKLVPKDPEPPKVPVSPLTSAAGATAPTEPQDAALPPELEPEPEAAPLGGSVSVSLDQLARPGALVSGKVTFSDGQRAEWYLDQSGRLGLSPATKGYRPSPPDLQSFQMELQRELEKMGF